MALDITNPEQIIMRLFGSIELFFMIYCIGIFYIASRYRFNLQISIWLVVFSSMIFGILFESWQNWYSIIIVLIGGLMSLVFWRYFRG